MSIFKYLTLSHLQKVLATLEIRFTGVENEIEEINEININTSSRLDDIENNIPLPYDNLPNADFNNGTMGSSDLYARGDHRHPSDSSKANVSDVLTKTNTTQYLPTNDYNPATKKYVDDSITSIPSNDFIITITQSGNTYSSDKTFNEIQTAYNSGKRCYAIYGSSSSYNVILPLCRMANALVVFSGVAQQSDSSDYLTYCIKINSSNEITWKSIYLNGRNITTDKETIAPRNYNASTTSFSSTAIQAYEIGDLFWRNYNVLAKATTAIASGDTLTENTNYVVTTIADELELKANVANVLTKTNTASYTPTSDYHPATKKYVDDATAGTTSNLSGLTDTIITSPSDGQILQYNSTTSKWENASLPIYGGEVTEIWNGGNY